MVKKQSRLKEKITVETRGLVDSFEEIKRKLKSLGAFPGEPEEIIDEHYADLTEATPANHTYEKMGKAARVRQVTVKGKTRVEVVVKEGLRRTNKGIFSHDVVRSKIIFNGKASEISQARKLVKEQGFPELILVVKKTRETYVLGGMDLCLESTEGFGPAVEARTLIGDENQVARVKETQVNCLKELGVREKDLLTSSMTHMLISARIASDPKVKVPYLRQKLKELEKKLEGKMNTSNLEYREAGDAWHDNLGWDSLMDELGLLRARIREIKEELTQIKELKN